MVQKFVKKQIVIEAIKFTRINWDEVKDFTQNKAHSLKCERRINGIGSCIINTLEGNMTAIENDYIIKGINGEFYPCKPDIFEKTYELFNY